MARVIGRVGTLEEAQATLDEFRALRLTYPESDPSRAKHPIDGWVHYDPTAKEYVVFSDEPGPEGPVV